MVAIDGVADGVVFATPSCNESSWIVTGGAAGAYDAPSTAALARRNAKAA